MYNFRYFLKNRKLPSVSYGSLKIYNLGNWNPQPSDLWAVTLPSELNMLTHFIINNLQYYEVNRTATWKKWVTHRKIVKLITWMYSFSYTVVECSLAWGCSQSYCMELNKDTYISRSTIIIHLYTFFIS